MPAMERVRLDVLETKRNSEKPRPKARIPPKNSFPTRENSIPASWKRKSFSDTDKGRPRNKTMSSRIPFPPPRIPLNKIDGGGLLTFQYQEDVEPVLHSPYFHKCGRQLLLCTL